MAAEPERLDPYQSWLGIAPHEQPPSYYRLFGLADFEEDAQAISRASAQAISRIRTFQAGESAAAAHRLLSELTVARSCLLDARRKEEYDVSLRVKRGIQGLPQRPQQPPRGTVHNVAPPLVATAPMHRTAPPGRPVLASIARRRAKKRFRELIAFVILLLTLIGLAITAAIVIR